MLRLITDFDGPVMDVSERYYRVYRYCLERLSTPDGPPLRVLSKAEFWDCKRAQVPEREIGQLSGLDEARSLEFARLRRETVHTLPYLVHDGPVPGAVAALERAQALGWDLVVMTMRRVRELDDAFNRHDLGRFFPAAGRYCLADDYVKTRDVEDKPKLMARAIGELSPAAATWMVGDTEADIAAARAGGIPIISVLSGIRNRDRLAAHQPDAIVDNLDAAIDFILARRAVAGGLPQTVSSPVQPLQSSVG
ncbi:MAG: HAD family hydrolase [Cyanobacteria bacterium]|nr:HAD family hydrolase [Cyanobacteriota bacterium]